MEQQGVVRDVGPSYPSTTTMKRFFKIKRKKSPKPPLQPTPPEKPADIVAGPSSLPAEQDVIPDGERNLSDGGPEVDHTYLEVLPNEQGRMDPRVSFQDGVDVGQELPTSGVSMSGITIDGAGYGNQLASKCT